MKILPKGTYEPDGADEYRRPKIISRRFPVKSMFLGVVGRPIPHRQFDGRILLERVSTTEPVTRQTATTNFSDDIFINNTIKSGEWRQLFQGISDLGCEDILNTVSSHYNLEHVVADRLELSYTTFIGIAGNIKNVQIDISTPNIFKLELRTDAENTVSKRNVLLKDLKIKVRYQQGDMVERECTCDSVYMSSAMRRVGEAMRAAYHWARQDTVLYLVLDNAGGHGTNECVRDYTNILKN